MIFELHFPEKTEFAQAKSQLHLLQSYNQEYDDFCDILEVIEISERDAKTILLNNTNYDEDDPEDVEKISLFDLVCGDYFSIVGSTEWE